MAGIGWPSRGRSEKAGPPRAGVSGRPGTRAYVEAAIRNRAFSLVYQPIVHLDTGAISGVEALCRFLDGRPPVDWFQQCEAIGLAAALDLAIIDMALEDVGQLPTGYLAVNLSAATLASPGALCDRMQPILDRTPLVLELTEHAVVDDYDAVADGMRLLRDRGVLLAVDDAGAGYSTFQHILRLRPDIIKLDRSITKGIDGDLARRALTNALVMFAAQIRASVVAEGIETEGELNGLRLTGVSQGQGFWLAKPSRLPLPGIQYRPAPLLDILQGSSDPLSGRSDPTLAVVTHGVLRSLLCVTNAVERLEASEEEAVPPEEFRALTSIMHTQLAYITGTLEDVLTGFPPETLKALEELAVPPDPSPRG
jgi:EAL domain-containing protein (putative c-di-GMP-specific phosphodiesterase class I)